MLIRRIIVLVIGFILDACFGDPVWLYHPVRIIGNLISFLEKLILPCCKKNKVKERVGGFILVLLVLILSVLIPAILLALAYKLHVIVGMVLEGFWVYQLLAAKGLWQESQKVKKALWVDLESGRRAVSMIVGRDTDSLDETGVIKATVETVAENTSDGIVAPLVFMTAFGAVGGFFYKAVNTMDSMIGYRNDKYEYFGTFGAKLDDFCNYIPARISALFMIVATGLCEAFGKVGSKLNKESAKNFYSIGDAYRIWRRDRRNHKSPNSAQTESVCAGALQIQLAGPACYFGKLHEKPYIGDDIRPIEAEDINRACVLMYLTSVITLVFCVGVLLIVNFSFTGFEFP